MNTPITGLSRAFRGHWLVLSMLWVGWALLTGRSETLCLCLIGAGLCLFHSFRANAIMRAAFSAVLMLSAFSPIGITLTDAEGPPRLIGCCPWGPPARYAAEIDCGRCRYCSDLVTGFEADRFLVW